MNATELMLGDLVMVSGKPMHVTFAMMHAGIEVKPIPLTPEILEKNGFKKDPEYSDTYWRPDCRKFCFVKENDDWYFAIRYAGGHICIAECNCVHKLRHILRDLLEMETEVVVC